MVGLGENLQGLGGHDMGRFSRALYKQVFPGMARYAKAREFLRLRQGSMTVLKYVAKFTELARFGMIMWPQIWPRSGNLRMV